MLDTSAREWSRLADVPGPGRLASTAVGVRDDVWLIGGYTVAEDGTEVSVPGIDVWTGTAWSSGPTMPTPVDDAVAALWRDRWLVLVSGWSNDDNVAAVQLYDMQRETWHEDTDIVGAPVFGAARASLSEPVVYFTEADSSSMRSIGALAASRSSSGMVSSGVWSRRHR